MSPERDRQHSERHEPKPQPPEKAGMAGGVCDRGKAGRKSKECQRGVGVQALRSTGRGVGPCPGERVDNISPQLEYPLSTMCAQGCSSARVPPVSTYSDEIQSEQTPESTRTDQALRLEGDSVRAHRPSPDPVINYLGEITYFSCRASAAYLQSRCDGWCLKCE